MKIHRDNIVRTQVHLGFERNTAPNTIVMHGTGGGGTLSWWRSGSTKYPHNKSAQRHKRGVGLTHYLILVNGKIIEVYDPATQWVYHSSSGEKDAKTIGIELENKSRKNENAYTSQQYKSAGRLVFYLMEKFKIQPEMIVTHDIMLKTQKKKAKGCPGPKFSMERLMANLNITELNNEVEYVDL